MSRRTRRVHPGSASIFAAILAAVVCVALGEEQPLEPGEAGQPLEPTSIDPPAPLGSTSPAIAAEDPTTVSTEHEVIMT